MSTLAATEVNVLVTTLSNLKIAENEQDLQLAKAQARTAQAFEETNSDLNERLNQLGDLTLQERTLTVQTKNGNDILETQQNRELETLRANRDSQAATLASQNGTLVETKTCSDVFLNTLRSIQTCINVRTIPIGTYHVKRYVCPGLVDPYNPDLSRMLNCNAGYTLEARSIYPDTQGNINNLIKSAHDQYPDKFKAQIAIRLAQEADAREKARLWELDRPNREHRANLERDRAQRSEDSRRAAEDRQGNK